MGNITDVTLVSGEKVQLALGSVCYQNQTFVRISKCLIAGVVNDPSTKNIYIWQEVNGSYDYLGDIFFNEQEDGSVIWKICVSTGTEEFKEQARKFLAKQAQVFTCSARKGGYIELLSTARGLHV